MEKLFIGMFKALDNVFAWTLQGYWTTVGVVLALWVVGRIFHIEGIALDRNLIK